jgi:hypothetical protein
MAVKTTETEYAPHIVFINDHSKHDAAGGLRTMTRADYLKMVEADGITPHILEAVNTSQERVIGAGIHIATDDLRTRVEAAREAGDDTGQLKNTVRIATPGGSTEVTVRATRVRNNPRTGEEVTKHGVVSAEIDADKRIPGDAADRARSVITKALGLTETPAAE